MFCSSKNNISYEMTTFIQNYKNLLVATLLFKINIAYGIKTQKLWVPKEPLKLKKDLKRKLITETYPSPCGMVWGQF